MGNGADFTHCNQEVTLTCSEAFSLSAFHIKETKSKVFIYFKLHKTIHEWSFQLIDCDSKNPYFVLRYVNKQCGLFVN